MSLIAENHANSEEVVYSPDMQDKELEALLNKIGHKISESVKSTSLQTQPVPTPTKHTWPVVVGAIAGIVATLAIIAGGIRFVVSSAITDALIGPSTTLTSLKEQGVSLRRDVDRLLDRSAQNIIKNPAAPAADLKDAANHLQQRKIQTPVQEVVSTGKTLQAHGQPNSEQWQAFLAFVGYRTFLNAKPDSAQAVGPLQPGNTWRYGFSPIPGKHEPVLTFTQGLGVPAQQAARMDRIGVDQNGALPRGPLLLVATGGAISLDDWQMRNTVFDGVEIHYSGQRTILENVTFVNCTFVMDNNIPGRRLGEEMLASAAVSFKSGA